MDGILITGGAGFVGSSLALRLKEEFPDSSIVCMDNLYRRGSDLNRARIEEAGISFVKADVRSRGSFDLPRCDLLIDAAAEPSVMAGRSGDAAYVVDTNLGGTLNLLETARTWDAAVLFLSTSRVYPVNRLRAVALEEVETRFEIAATQSLPGITAAGIAEEFPLQSEEEAAGPGSRTLYGATKYASEIMVREYAAHFGLKAMINRCGVLAGPWQMGRVDQGVVALWTAAHIYGKPLSYIGYAGKQVRDVLHMDDLADLVIRQIGRSGSWNGGVYNVGGGRRISFSLLELTDLVGSITGESIEIDVVDEIRQGDVPLYITDSSEASRAFDWTARRTVTEIIEDTARWITNNKPVLHPVLAPYEN